MSYHAAIVFTGLSFFCIPGANPDDACPADDDTFYAYVVNASGPQDVCGRRLDGDHEAVLSFARRHLEYADSALYRLVPSPDGGQLVVAPLRKLPGVGNGRGFDICFREECVGPEPCEVPWPTPPETADPWPGLSEKQDTPKAFKPDAHNIGWLPRVSHVDKRCSFDLRSEVADLDRAYVHGRVRLDWGRLATGGHMRRPQKFIARSYVVWGSDRQAGHMPKAFAGHVTLQLPDLRGALLIQTGCGRGDTPRTLFRLRSAPFGILHVNVSNLPDHEVDSVGQTVQDHFRWYYRLFDYFAHLDADGNPMMDAQGDPAFDARGYEQFDRDCPPDIGIPQTSSSMTKNAWLKGVINVNTLCPPAGKK